MLGDGVEQTVWRKNRCYLLKQVDHVTLGDIVDYLYQREALTQQSKERIQAEKTHTEKMRCLIDELRSQIVFEERFIQFLEALKYAECHHVREHLQLHYIYLEAHRQYLQNLNQDNQDQVDGQDIPDATSEMSSNHRKSKKRKYEFTTTPNQRIGLHFVQGSQFPRWWNDRGVYIGCIQKNSLAQSLRIPVGATLHKINGERVRDWDYVQNFLTSRSVIESITVR